MEVESIPSIMRGGGERRDGDTSKWREDEDL
jgi:hypothetical protein